MKKQKNLAVGFAPPPPPPLRPSPPAEEATKG